MKSIASLHQGRHTVDCVTEWPMTWKAKLVHVDNVSAAWDNLMTAAMIPGCRWRDMRHDFASKPVMVGVDLNTVRELLGHGDIKMTLRYAHLSPKVKVEAVERIVGKANESVVPFSAGEAGP
jgi:integrase